MVEMDIRQCSIDQLLQEKGRAGKEKDRRESIKREEENKHSALPAQMNGWTGGGQASSP